MYLCIIYVHATAQLTILREEEIMSKFLINYNIHVYASAIKDYLLIHYTHLKYIQKYIGKYITIIFFFFGLKWNSQKKNRKKLLFPIKRLYSLLDNASNYLPIVGCVIQKRSTTSSFWFNRCFDVDKDLHNEHDKQAIEVLVHTWPRKKTTKRRLLLGKSKDSYPTQCSCVNATFSMVNCALYTGRWISKARSQIEAPSKYTSKEIELEKTTRYFKLDSRYVGLKLFYCHTSAITSDG